MDNTPIYIMGIDPGLQGAISLFDITGIQKDPIIIPMPTEKQKRKLVGKKTEKEETKIQIYPLYVVFRNLKIKKVFIEDVHSIYGVSAGSNFSFGFGLGQIYGMIECLDIPYTKVQPKEWQKFLWKEKDIVLFDKKKVDTKQSTINAIKRIFPNCSLQKTKRCKKEHDGIADSLGILYFGIMSGGDRDVWRKNI